MRRPQRHWHVDAAETSWAARTLYSKVDNRADPAGVRHTPSHPAAACRHPVEANGASLSLVRLSRPGAYRELLGVAYFIAGPSGFTGPVGKALSPGVCAAMLSKLNGEVGDSVLLIAGEPRVFYKFAGELRQKLAVELEVMSKNRFEFCWITDFPMYEWDEKAQRINFCHNPFSMPQGGLQALEAAITTEQRLALNAYQYDIVRNGIELSSGAIRNHDLRIMYKAFEIAGYGPADLQEKFGGLLRASQFGEPPHGGIAPGIDRMVMLLAGAANLRDVVMFPMNQQSEDLMMGAPGVVTAQQLKELHIGVTRPVPAVLAER